MRSLRLALGFLTTLPVQPPAGLAPGELGRAAAWYPLVGLAMGGLLWLLNHVLSTVFPGLLTAVLVLAFWVLMSGSLHLDGWADCCDGMFVSASKERRLEILRDSQLGTFAAVGLTLLLLIKVAAIANLVSRLALVIAPVLGRGLLPILARSKPARPDGLGARLHQEVQWVSSLTLLLVLPIIYFAGWRGLLASVTAVVTALIWIRLAQSRLGGQTGDVLGAACELIELVVLLAFAGAVHETVF
jgi:adenosylcobinamide-GDP ribazoletransferase